MKIHTKKKRYQLHCKRQAQKGLVNTPDGNWTKIDLNNRMHYHYASGHRV